MHVCTVILIKFFNFEKQNSIATVQIFRGNIVTLCVFITEYIICGTLWTCWNVYWNVKLKWTVIYYRYSSSTWCFMVLKLSTLSSFVVIKLLSALALIISLDCWMAKNGSDHYFEHCPNFISLCKLIWSISQKLNKLLKYFCLHYFF